MTNASIAQTAPVLVAIDIAKARHEVLIAIPGRKRRRRLTVLNQLEDFNRLVAILSEYGHPVRVAFEATGNYHRALAYQLGEGKDPHGTVALTCSGDVFVECLPILGGQFEEIIDEIDLTYA